MLTDIGDIRKAYGLEKGKRVVLKKPFSVTKIKPTWTFGDIRSLGHNHAYTDGGMPIGLASLESRVKEELIRAAP